MNATGELPIAECIDKAAVWTQLERILRSPSFVRSAQLSAFFRLIVSSSIEGRAAELKETWIATQVFRRPCDYDPKLDPIVRVEARRLRAKLLEYYEQDGLKDPILIRLPKGAYRPEFLPKHPSDSETLTELSVPEGHFPLPLLAATSENVLTRRTMSGISRWVRDYRPYRTARLLASGALLVLCLGAWLWNRSDHAKTLRFFPVTTFVGEEFSPALSPDGRQVAFVADKVPGTFSIYIKPLGSDTFRRLTNNTSYDLRPTWSPDGRDIAFVRMNPTQTLLMTIPSLGGPEHQIAALRTPINFWQKNAMYIHAGPAVVWSMDGKSLIVSDQSGGTDGLALRRLSLVEDRSEAVTSPPPGSSDLYPAISLDGRELAFARLTSNSAADIYVLDLDGPYKLRQITADERDIRGLTWAPDGRSLFFSANRDGDYGLWNLRIEDHSINRVDDDSSGATEPSMSLDGQTLVFTQATQNTNIWLLPFASTPVPQTAQRLIASSRRNNSAQYSPDGKRIVFVSDRSGSWEIWISNSDGSEEQKLTDFHGPMVGTPRWSPDGSKIAFDARPNGRSAIFVEDVLHRSIRSVVEDAFEERMPSWSVDGSFLYFSSNRTGTPKVWRVTAEGGNLAEVTEHSGFDSFSALNGTVLIFRGSENRLWRRDLNTKVEAPIQQLSGDFSDRYFAVSGDKIYFAEAGSHARAVLCFDLKTNQLKTVAVLPGEIVAGTPSLSISPDQRFILFAREDLSTSDILGEILSKKPSP